ncbi:hypothetical protein [Kribbella italica]|uniref:Uncharacterized BrkB/YihY/UPF0761 family membrane protein n=1 Tax=Kribbella italica TaxID=1540520 RepID=A0A7W9JCG3_9ACTN|nr:hypothetical protein [Kribbella italica]MBB5839435.1 uncharacterized BrkB/YihY/UPF0761 family membrane protein [Kribbella italica]
MSSPQFPTYGRGDDPDEPDRSEYYAKPVPYGHDNYPQPPAEQPPAYGYGQPGDTQDHHQPPAYRPGHPYGAASAPQSHQLPSYGPEPRRDPRAARVVLLAAVIAAVYGLLVVSVQRVSLREISQAPGSPLNHPLRTDVLDTIGQLLVLIVGAAALAMWLRDLQVRRKARRELDPFELGGLGLVALSLIPILIWLGLVLSTGLGAIDDSLHRLPTAYGWGGFGLLVLALGFALGYRELKPEVSNPVVQAAPDRPPWE